MAIPRIKIVEILAEIKAWLSEDTIQLRELQKLLGRIFHATKCCVGARLFCNRLLDGLRVAYRHGHTPITTEMHMDLFWMVAFLNEFNGLHLTRDPRVTEIMYVDSCLTAGGAIWDKQMYTAVYTPHVWRVAGTVGSWKCTICSWRYDFGRRPSEARTWLSSAITRPPWRFFNQAGRQTLSSGLVRERHGCWQISMI